jgi:hypothetical protein
MSPLPYATRARCARAHQRAERAIAEVACERERRKFGRVR